MLMMGDRLPMKIHGNQDRIPQITQLPFVSVSADDGIGRFITAVIVDHMLLFKISNSVVESVSQKDGKIIHPGVPGRS